MSPHRKTLALLFAGCVLLSSPLAAQVVGDPVAGKTKATVCAGCHGVDGNSTFGEWPKLAGQHEQYIVRQVKNFQSKNRNNALMYPMIVNLTEQDAADIGSYFAQQKVKPGTADESLVDVGKRLYMGGAAGRGIPACMACHGPGGRGNPGAKYPSVTGQHATYTASVLTRFQGGKVWGEGDDANAIMASIAGRLTDDEITALASYIEGLH